MARPEAEAKPHFSQPIRQVISMLIVLALTGMGAFFALPRVLPVFMANPYLNGFILFVFIIGIVSCIWQVVQLIGSVRWIESFAAEDQEAGKAPQLLASLATLLRSRGSRMQINASSSRSILDSVAQRIDEVREITRYIVSTLIFLGLLGTFYGLATTVPAVVDTIRSLAPQDGEGGVEVFNRLMTGLEAQLGGMGVAFASSLLGLAGSLVVGLLELFAGHGQNRFYRELEEWLSSITRLGFASGDEGGAGDAAALSGVVDHMAEQMESLQQMFTDSDVSRAMVDEKLGKLADSMTRLVDKFDSGDAATQALERVAEGQERLIGLMEKQGAGEGLDAESRMRLRSIDVQMLRLLEEISAGRQESVGELRSDLREVLDTLKGDRTNVRRLRVRSGPDA
ncbi:biopolymer transporter ExbB [Aliishimia ponticola]|uniref:biopolymer transporter ExbB n=1 Tax=Aliishimia ponticola TaxID=2499833 RepID=UPI001FEBE19F|nr:biopolymer transporter ExbB [Aliishimia ponticola]